MLQRLSKRSLLARTLDVSGCCHALRTVHAWKGVLVLNYHRIGDARHSLLDRNLWSATAQDFERQIELLASRFHVIGLPDLERALAAPHDRHVMVTFDDGYRDNYSLAYPILKRHGVPATFFVTTGFVDSPRVPWWDEIAWMVRTSPLTALDVNRWTLSPVPFDTPDREVAIARLLSAFKGLPGEVTEDYLEFLSEALQTGRCSNQVAHELWMTWDMIREMKSNGMTFGGHTVTHPILSNLPSQQQDWEVGECKRRLIEELDEPIEAFSYPVGGRASFNVFTRASLARHGYRWGFTYTGGHCRPGHQDPYSINRAAIELETDSSLFRALTTLPQLFA